MKTGKVLGYTCIGIGVAGTYVLTYLIGVRSGFSKACKECIGLTKEVINQNKKEDKVEEESK